MYLYMTEPPGYQIVKSKDYPSMGTKPVSVKKLDLWPMIEQ